MKPEEMTPGMLKAFRAFARTNVKSGITTTITVNGGDSVTITPESAKRIVKRCDELLKTKPAPPKRED